MSKIFRIINFFSKAVLGLVLLGLAPSAFANLVQNGSFEIGNFVPDIPPQRMYLTDGATDITGWTIENDLIWRSNDGNPVITASDGNFFLDLTEGEFTPEPAGISQNITTIVGQNYKLSLDLGSNPGNGLPVQVTAIAAGTSQVFTSTNVNTQDSWETFDLFFTAISTSTQIKFLETSPFGSTTYIGLDNISVMEADLSVIPVPAAVWLFGTALIGLVGFSKRRKAI